MVGTDERQSDAGQIARTMITGRFRNCSSPFKNGVILYSTIQTIAAIDTPSKLGVASSSAGPSYGDGFSIALKSQVSEIVPVVRAVVVLSVAVSPNLIGVVD
jgi:hypothetical protein